MNSVSQLAVAAAVAACITPLAASGGGSKPAPAATPPVQLKILSPAYKSDKPLGIMYESGTTLEFEATIAGPSLGIATNRPSSYIGYFDVGWIVFKDPDNCLEIALSAVPMELQRSCLTALYPQIPPGSTDMSPIVADETYLQFSNDNDQAGVPDHNSPGSPLGDPLLSGEPEFMVLSRDFKGGLHGISDPPAPVSTPIGPYTGDSVDDGYGYGADDDFPGLVVLSARGVGLVYADADGFPGTKTSSLTPVSPRAQWNLAGFLNSVGYELKSINGKTVIHASMNLQHGLIAPIIALDNCIGVYDGGSFCDTDQHRYRVDGGPVQTVAGGRSAHDLWGALFPSLTYEVRAFVVSGTAPSQLADLNNDGKVTAADAKIAGYTVISDEAVTRFRQVSGFICFENTLTTIFGLDLDGNGQAQIGIACPPGAGALKKIP